MHTAICSFEDRARAEAAVDRLVQAGFDPGDVHLRSRDSGRHSGTNQWDSMEREVATGPGVLSSFGHFFTSLFGADDIHGHAGGYAKAVEQGRYVVLVDVRDDAEADRAEALMRELQAGDAKVVDRQNLRPLREILKDSQLTSTGMERSFDGARDELGTRSRDDVDEPGFTVTERERAMASGMGEQYKLGTRTGPDLTEPPGLRDADKDKPGR